ncbi:hypothetical protein PQX77_014969, partial [Marasmius sp. AFHP31]
TMKGHLYLLSVASTIALTAAMAIQPRAPILSDVLDAHNSFRAQHGAAPLVWNDTLATAAETFASKCVFQTSGGPYGGTCLIRNMSRDGRLMEVIRFYYTENVAAGAGGGYNAMRAVQSWMDGACGSSPYSTVPVAHDRLLPLYSEIRSQESNGKSRSTRVHADGLEEYREAWMCSCSVR